MRTIGNRRRSALTRSRARVSSFSLASSSLRAANHSSRETTSGRFSIVVMPARYPQTQWGHELGHLRARARALGAPRRRRAAGGRPAAGCCSSSAPRWAHQGGTWSIPGGARERGECAVQAALREAHEEMAIDAGDVEVRSSYVASCGGWEYETVLAVAAGPVHAGARLGVRGSRLGDPDEVADLPLHPAFRAAWTAPDGELRSFVAATA